MSDQKPDTARPKTRRTKDTPSHRITDALLDRATLISQLDPHPQNARRRDDRAEAELRQSLEVNGQYRTVVARELGDRLQMLAGHGTVQAARQLGWTHVAVDVHAGLSDEAAARIVLVDNRTNDLAGYDDDLLAELLASLDDLAGTGFTDADLAALLAGVGDEPAALTDPDDAPALPKDAPISKDGDVWLLGPHRLLCGDSTDAGAVALMLNGDHPDAVWTDPPYGVSYVGKTADAMTIQNDGQSDLPELLLAAFQTIAAVCRPGAPVYVAHADKERVVFEQSMLDAGLLVRQNLVWVKNTIVMGRADYHYKHEPILYGFTPEGSGRLGRGGPNWHGDHKASTVLEFPKPARNGEHPTMKPVALIEETLKNSLPPGGLVLDLFGGSGSTLIAAHHMRSRAALVELDPRYADVICRRYQQHTGVAPVLEATGEPVDFTTTGGE